MTVACNVVGCLYVAEAFITECGDFPVCPLHDGLHVRRMLDTLQRPGAFWTQLGRPIVVPVGVLGEDDLAHRPAVVIFRTENEDSLARHADADGTLRAENDPKLRDLYTGPTTTLAQFDLMKSLSDPSAT